MADTSCGSGVVIASSTTFAIYAREGERLRDVVEEGGGGKGRTGFQTEEREGYDTLVDEDRVLFATPDELRERERDGGRSEDDHCGALPLVDGGVFVPKSTDHVDENACALAFDRRRVGALD